MDDSGWWQREDDEQFVEAGPRQPLFAASTIQPIAPRPLYVLIVLTHASIVAPDSVVLVVTPQLRAQGLPLLAHWFMPVVPTPLPDSFSGAPQSLARRLSFHYPGSLPRFRPVVSKAQKSERAVTLAIVFQLWPTELDQLRLRRMDRQAVTPEPLGQHRHDAVRVTLQLTADNEIICEPDQITAPLHARFHVPLEPLVQHLMEVDIR